MALQPSDEHDGKRLYPVPVEINTCSRLLNGVYFKCALHGKGEDACILNSDLRTCRAGYGSILLHEDEVPVYMAARMGVLDG